MPNKSDVAIPKVFHMVHYYYPSSGQALCHSFARWSHLLPSELPGKHTGHKAASRCSELIWNDHYSSTHHHYQVPILHLGEMRHTWSSHPAQGCYIVSQLAALRFKPMTCIFTVPHTIHSATTSPHIIWHAHAISSWILCYIWHFMTLWNLVSGYRSQNQISSKNKWQCSIRKAHHGHKLSTREAWRCVLHCTLNNSIMVDMGLCLFEALGDKNVVQTQHWITK